MNLELKHLAPYLPYGLKAKLSQEGEFNLDNEYPNEYCNDICTITDFTTYSKDLGGSMKVDKTKDYRFDFDSLSEIEIILRPLSDLTKDINYGLSTYAFTDLFEIGDCDGCVFEFEHGNIKTIKALENISKYNSYNDINYLPNAVVNMMYEYHFDVFGLIPQGLAIDVNTLK